MNRLNALKMKTGVQHTARNIFAGMVREISSVVVSNAIKSTWYAQNIRHPIGIPMSKYSKPLREGHKKLKGLGARHSGLDEIRDRIAACDPGAKSAPVKK